MYPNDVSEQELVDAVNKLFSTIGNLTNKKANKITSYDKSAFRQIYFGTGFFEVSGETLDTGKSEIDKDIRYFLPINELLNGNVKIDTKTGKAEVLRDIPSTSSKKLDKTTLIWMMI